MDTTETIWLFKAPNEDCWLMQTDSPKTFELFGTDILPTAFLASAPAENVLKQIQRLNPLAIIELA
jgi:hypothetical protein